MKIESIKIENFKGIGNLKIDFSKSPHGRFYTLVGLNESGKTTILEAINNFCYGPERLKGIDLDEVGVTPPQDMIPISKRGNFNEEIKIAVTVSFQEDIISLKKHLVRKFPDLHITSISDATTVSYEHKFENSQPKNSSRYWWFSIRGRRGQERKVKDFTKTEIWTEAVRYLSELFPDIIYFPNFLFEFPDKIYLNSDNEKDVFYCKLLQDILNSLKKGYDIKEHILNRMISDDDEQQRNMRAVLLEMEREITKTVSKFWTHIFGGTTTTKKIILNTGKNIEENGDIKYYIEFSLEDADGLFHISERSLGFRWFFVFRLLTYYRGHRNSQNSTKKYFSY